MPRRWKVLPGRHIVDQQGQKLACRWLDEDDELAQLPANAANLYLANVEEEAGTQRKRAKKKIETLDELLDAEPEEQDEE